VETDYGSSTSGVAEYSVNYYLKEMPTFATISRTQRKRTVEGGDARCQVDISFAKSVEN